MSTTEESAATPRRRRADAVRNSEAVLEAAKAAFAESGVDAPMRDIAQRRADFARQVAFVRQSDDERSSMTTTLAAIAQEAPVGLHFDSLHVSRIASGWSAVIGGQTTGATSAQSVRNLDTFVNSVRTRQGISAASLDQFDYPAATDTTHAASPGVEIMFRLTFQIARGRQPSGAP